MTRDEARKAAEEVVTLSRCHRRQETGELILVDPDELKEVIADTLMAACRQERGNVGL